MYKKEKVFFKTFGCRTNVFDTQVMMNKLKDFEITQNEKDANIVVINSCTVTNSADSTARSYINSLSKLTHKPRIIFTGCGVWTKGESLFKENKIDALFGHSEKEKINILLKNDTKFFEAGDLKHIDDTIIEKMIGKSKAFVKIQEGCDFRCSYCIIPYVRGDARSYDEQHILNQISTLASNGFGEFILTGTNVGSYGKELSKLSKDSTKKKDKLAQLLKKISMIRGVRRVRLGSVEPMQITDEFKEILEEPWMGKQLHIALQHTNKEMLNIMNRRNKVKSDLELFELLASKGYALGTDFIVGHPGESKEFWEDAIKNIEKFPLTHIHSFTYSKRDGTPSCTMSKEVNGDIAKQRLKQLENIIENKNYEFRKKQNTLEILVESKKDNIYTGYDQYFNQIEIHSDTNLVGDWIELSNYEVKDKTNVSKF
ncbi:MAG: tRNA (N(6)-L-threonylcarbamoyladenosine(37)-C(2))-methylthiotransferase MtaB [Campylobacterota bacterium]|nr:tRNA (N(6)-L-threonylcarbamoyladenosine(37)-C(2))-methylthiotransferase MtaB [Campylobacterota bacterium]